MQGRITLKEMYQIQQEPKQSTNSKYDNNK